MFQYLASHRPLSALAIHDFCIDFGAASLFESVDLQINGLLFRANPGVASFHAPLKAGLEEVHFTHQLRQPACELKTSAGVSPMGILTTLQELEAIYGSPAEASIVKEVD